MNDKVFINQVNQAHQAVTCSKLTIETLEQDVKYVHLMALWMLIMIKKVF